MREITFRGMTENKKWVYGSLIQHGKYCCILEHDDDDMDFPYLDADIGTIDGRATPVIPETVGQYTGINIATDLPDGDTEVAFIYEGDIVEFESHGYIPRIERGIVTFNNGCFGIEYLTEIARKFGWDKNFHRIGEKSEWRDMGASGTITYTYEIIGNIHDNLELLEAK